MFYAIVPLIMWGVRRFGPRGQFLVILGIYLASIGYREILWHWRDVTGRQSTRPSPSSCPARWCFSSSASGAMSFSTVEVRHLVVGAYRHRPACSGWMRKRAQPLLLGLGVIYLGVFFPFLGNFGRYGDFSYGMYIWHFPLIQAVIALAWLPSIRWWPVSGSRLRSCSWPSCPGATSSDPS